MEKMKTNRTSIFIILLMTCVLGVCFVVFGIMAMISTNSSSNIVVRYTANQVAGTMFAKSSFDGENYVNMTSNSQTVLTFDGTESQSTTGLSPSEQFTFRGMDDYALFVYAFTNASNDRDYTITLNCDLSLLANLTLSYCPFLTTSLVNANLVNDNCPWQVATSNTAFASRIVKQDANSSTATYYAYVKLQVTQENKSSHFDNTISWTLDATGPNATMYNLNYDLGEDFLWGNKMHPTFYFAGDTFAIPFASDKVAPPTVSFEANGGVCATSSLTATKCIGWNTDGGSSVNVTSALVSNISASGSTVTLYPVSNTNPTVFLPSAEPTLLQTSQGLVFAGWYDAQTGDTLIGNAGASYVPNADITLYAQWGFPISYETTHTFESGSYMTDIRQTGFYQPQQLVLYSYTSVSYTVTQSISSCANTIPLGHDLVFTIQLGNTYNSSTQNGQGRGLPSAGTDPVSLLKSGWELSERLTITIGGDAYTVENCEKNDDTITVTIPGSAVIGDIVIAFK